MKRQILRALSLMITLILITALLPAQAEQAETGTITIQIKANNPQNKDYRKNDIRLRAYLVASGDYGLWKMVDKYAGIKVYTSDPNDDGSEWIDKSMAEIQTLINGNGDETKRITCDQKGYSDVNGIVTIPGLKKGIYYISADNLPPYLELKPMLIAVPNQAGEMLAKGVTKGDYNPKYDDGNGGGGGRNHFESIDEYETALGLGNIQMHVGVCFE